jgi:putative Ca2+/H+ antiporter (TMEM165/GDT1 family)
MGFSLIEGFTKSLAMTVLSEIGDKTFFAAAVNNFVITFFRLGFMLVVRWI